MKNRQYKKRKYDKFIINTSIHSYSMEYCTKCKFKYKYCPVMQHLSETV